MHLWLKVLMEETLWQALDNDNIKTVLNLLISLNCLGIRFNGRFGNDDYETLGTTTNSLTVFSEKSFVLKIFFISRLRCLLHIMADNVKIYKIILLMIYECHGPNCFFFSAGCILPTPDLVIYSVSNTTVKILTNEKSTASRITGGDSKKISFF